MSLQSLLCLFMRNSTIFMVFGGGGGGIIMLGEGGSTRRLTREFSFISDEILNNCLRFTMKSKKSRNSRNSPGVDGKLSP